MPTVFYIDECTWNEEDDGVRMEFVHQAGAKLAEIALVNFDAKLWKFEALLPEKFHLEGRNPSGVVFSSAAAKRVCETILLNTIVIR